MMKMILCKIFGHDHRPAYNLFNPPSNRAIGMKDYKCKRCGLRQDKDKNALREAYQTQDWINKELCTKKEYEKRRKELIKSAEKEGFKW